MVDMGTLKPGATYIYERHDGIVYAREFGADPGTRFVVGYDSAEKYNPLRDEVKENQLWHNIRRAAETNPTLKDALDRCVEIYSLIKDE